jgi:hypothetical protein
MHQPDAGLTGRCPVQPSTPLGPDQVNVIIVIIIFVSRKEESSVHLNESGSRHFEVGIHWPRKMIAKGRSRLLQRPSRRYDAKREVRHQELFNGGWDAASKAHKSQSIERLLSKGSPIINNSVFGATSSLFFGTPLVLPRTPCHVFERHPYVISPPLGDAIVRSRNS